ncbi:MAG: MFS transporter [Bacteroidia bacterium]|nr:MFS transporter [Bacteroidia bacterium]
MKGLTTTTKVLYGLGFSSQGIKDGLFQIFLFFYFSQVLGLDAALAGTASLLALMFDAVSDPLVGLLSDKWKSAKWGRRHPFMLVSALPLGVFTYLLFAPPESLEQNGLFWWMTSFSVLVRLALTFFIVPHMSLGAELTTDYKERTSVTAYRIMFAAFISPVIMIIGFLFYFPATEEFSNGLFNKSAYPDFALLCSILMIIAILVCVYGTKKMIPLLPKLSAEQERLSTTQLFASLNEAAKMRSFWSLILFVMMVYVGIGVGVVFSTYFGTYYFEFSTKEMAALPIGSAIGGILALLVAPGLGERLDKKRAAIYSTVIFAVFFSLPFLLRMIGAFPSNGDPALLGIYVVTLIIAYMFLWVSFSLANSMMADVIDEYELRFKKRQEGLFFAAMSFAFKCTTGLGQFIAGILLSWIAFPKQAKLGEIPQEAVDGLGMVGGPILLMFYLSSIIFILYYPINKAKYKEIRTVLEAR